MAAEQKAGGVSPHDSRAARVASLAALSLAAWTALTTLACLFAASGNLPYADEWDIWMSRLKQGYTAGWFFALHNDHRIATTRAVFALDHLLFRGRAWFPQAVSVGVALALLRLLWRFARRIEGAGPLDGVLAGALVCCLFSAQQSINFMWGFQVQFFLVYALAAGTFWALLRASESAGRSASDVWMAACLAMAAAASYSMANGVLVWPLLLLAALRTRMGRWRVAMIAAGGVVVFVLYFNGWHSSPLDAPAPAWKMLLFALANAGSPIVPMLRVIAGHAALVDIAAAVVGWMVLTAAGMAWWGTWRSQQELTDGKMRPSGLLAHFAVFVGAASFAIAAGRAHLPLAEAFRSRYITGPYILWATLLILAWPRLGRWGEARLGWAVVIALAIGITPYQLGKLREAGAYGAGRRQAAVALAANVNDPDVWPYLERPVTDSAPAADWLREQKLANFSDRWNDWLSRPMAPPPSTASVMWCRSASRNEPVALNDRGRPGWRISGSEAEGLDFVVLSGDRSRVVESVAPVENGAWSLYARPGESVVAVFGIRPNGGTCLAALEKLPESP